MHSSIRTKGHRQVSLRNSLLMLVLVCVGPALVLIGFNIFENYLLFRSKIYSETQRLAESMVADVDRELSGIESGLKVLATSEALAKGDLQQFHKIAKEAVKSQIVYNYILTNQKGHQVLNTLIPFGSELPKKGTPEQLSQVFSERRPVLTDYFIGPVTGKGAIAVGVPVLNDKGEVQYSLNIGLAPEKLAELLKRRPLPDGWLAALIDSSGTIVGRTRDEKQFIGTKAVSELRTSIAARRNGTMDTLTKEGVAVSTAFASSEQWGWSVAVGAPKGLMEAQLKKKVMSAAILVSAVLIAGGWIALSIIRHLTQSIDALNRAALEIVQGKPVDLPYVRLAEADAIGQALVQASQLTSETHHRAYHDALTNLPNRPLFFEFLENSVARAQRSGETFSLLAVDLDHFKHVNDRHGHAAGDALLKEVANRINGEIRAMDLAARIGGDEFAVLLMNSGTDAARDVAGRLCCSLAMPYPECTVAVTASIGFVTWRPDISDGEKLRELADRALYRVKDNGRNGFMGAEP